jgi:copper chaperone
MLRYQVKGMSCGHCVKAITSAIHDVDPAAKVDIDLQAKDVAIETTASSESVIKAIEDAGYEVVR